MEITANSSSFAVPGPGRVGRNPGGPVPPEAKTGADSTDSEAKTQGTAAKGNPADRGLTPEEKKQVEKLKARDREVRAHEQAHKAAAGSLAIGGPTFEFTRGPDGRQYAVGGEVNIDASAVPNDPEATIRKAQAIRRAALAPAEPSSQDRNVAAKAATLENRARQELTKERTEKAKEGTASGSSSNATAGAKGPETGPPEKTPPDAKNQNTPNLTAARQIRQFSQDPVSTSGQLLNLFS